MQKMAIIYPNSHAPERSDGSTMDQHHDPGPACRPVRRDTQTLHLFVNCAAALCGRAEPRSVSDFTKNTISLSNPRRHS